MGLRNTLAQHRCYITAQHAAMTYLGRVWGCMPMRDALNKLRNRPLPAAREGQCIRGFLLLSTREEVNELGPPHCSYWLFTIIINTASKRSRLSVPRSHFALTLSNALDMHEKIEIGAEIGSSCRFKLKTEPNCDGIIMRLNMFFCRGIGGNKKAPITSQ